MGAGADLARWASAPASATSSTTCSTAPGIPGAASGTSCGSIRRSGSAHMFLIRRLVIRDWCSARWSDVTRRFHNRKSHIHKVARRTRSGTRTPSSTRCTSARSSTATATASATSRAHAEARLPRRTSASRASGCCRSIRRRSATTGTTSRTTRRIHPIYGTLDDFKRLRGRGARAAHPRPHRAGRQPHVRPASVVPARAPGAAGIARARLLRLERHGREVRAAHGSSSPTPRRRTGRGIRSRASTTGIASSPTSPI